MYHIAFDNTIVYVCPSSPRNVAEKPPTCISSLQIPSRPITSPRPVSCQVGRSVGRRADQRSATAENESSVRRHERQFRSTSFSVIANTETIPHAQGEEAIWHDTDISEVCKIEIQLITTQTGRLVTSRENERFLRGRRVVTGGPRCPKGYIS
jgi:hypothetical protein